MMLRRSLLLTVVSVVVACSAHADTPSATPTALPKSGVLASTSLSSGGRIVVVDNFGGDDITGRDVVPLAGSIIRKPTNDWSIKVTNNSKDTYSVNVDFIQRDRDGRQIKFGSYSHYLSGGDAKTQDVSVAPGANSAELILRSYRNISEERRAKAAAR